VPNEETFYLALTGLRTPFAFDVQEAGSLTNQRVFADPLPLDGRNFTPDA
jgi:hypothetical protein